MGSLYLPSAQESYLDVDEVLALLSFWILMNILQYKIVDNWKSRRKKPSFIYADL